MNKQEYSREREAAAMDYVRQQAEGMRNIGMSGQAYMGAGLAAVMTEEQRKRHVAKLDETRQLTGRYTCGLEPSGEWVDDYPATLFLYQIKQEVDLDKFKQECEEIDNE